MSDLTTLANAKAWLGLTTTADDTLLSRLVSAVSAFCEQWTNRTFTLTTYAETRDGTGSDRLMFRHTPVVAVTSVLVGNDMVPARTVLGQTGWIADDAFLTYDGGIFPRGRGNVVIQYEAGYATVPLEIEQSVLELVGILYKERGRIGLTSQGVQGETTAYLVKALPDRVAAVWQQHKRVVLP